MTQVIVGSFHYYFAFKPKQQKDKYETITMGGNMKYVHQVHINIVDGMYKKNSWKFFRLLKKNDTIYVVQGSIKLQPLGKTSPSASEKPEANPKYCWLDIPIFICKINPWASGHRLGRAE